MPGLKTSSLIQQL